jgi:hypothetical protein
VRRADAGWRNRFSTADESNLADNGLMHFTKKRLNNLALKTAADPRRLLEQESEEPGRPHFKSLFEPFVPDPNHVLNEPLRRVDGSSGLCAEKCKWQGSAALLIQDELRLRHTRFVKRCGVDGHPNLSWQSYDSPFIEERNHQKSVCGFLVQQEGLIH